MGLTIVSLSDTAACIMVSVCMSVGVAVEIAGGLVG